MELTLVVLIGTVLATMVGVGYYAQYVSRRRVEAAAARLAADLEYARQEAIHASASRTVLFTAKGYRLQGVQHPDRASGDYVVDLSQEPYCAKLASVDFEGAQQVAFDIYGQPDKGGQVVLSVGDWTMTVTLEAQTGLADVR